MAYFNIPMKKTPKFKVDDIVVCVPGTIYCGEVWRITALDGKQSKDLPYLYTVTSMKRIYSFFLYEDEIELYKGVNPMALKFKVGDLVKTTTTVGLDYQSFPVDSEARVVAIIPRSGIPYPYMINLTAFNRDVVVMEREIEFANGPNTLPKTPPIYRKLVSPSGIFYIVEDNHGTHYTIIDTDDSILSKGTRHNKNMFVNCVEDKLYATAIKPRTSSNTFTMMPSIKDLMNDTKLPSGQANVTQGCKHKWIPYTGLSESYEFCSICDTKRGKKVIV